MQKEFGGTAIGVLWLHQKVTAVMYLFLVKGFNLQFLQLPFLAITYNRLYNKCMFQLLTGVCQLTLYNGYKLVVVVACYKPCQLVTPATARIVTPSSDSVFQSLEDSLDDVFYEEPMPTSAVVMAADELPSLRQRHNSENAPNSSQTQSSRPSHPLSAAYYEMPSLSEDRYSLYVFNVHFMIIIYDLIFAV